MSSKEQAKQQAIDELRNALKPGDTVYTIVRHVARSGMSRRIDVYKLQDGAPHYLTGLVAKACGFSFPAKGEGLNIGGCGMDMGFAVVYELGMVLFKDGWQCLGDHCPHNSHVNDRNAPRGKGVIHKDGRYSLNQRWL